MTLYLDRRAELTVSRLDQSTFFATEPGNAIIIRDRDEVTGGRVGLRVTFSIAKSLTSDPNTCEVTIYNLAERTRSALQHNPLQVRLDAGYQGNVQTIFVGDLKRAPSTPTGVDWATKLELGDGARAYKRATVSRSYLGGVNVRTLVGDLAKSMGLTVPRTIAEAREFGNELAGGEALHGPSAREMSRVLKAQNLSWSVQDGQLQILRPTDVRANEAIVSPEYGPPAKPGGAPLLTVRVLLQPDLTPGGKIHVRSRAINGNFRMERVVHTGDTAGQDWYSTIEAKAL
jgi:hypothetical protein